MPDKVADSRRMGKLPLDATSLEQASGVDELRVMLEEKADQISRLQYQKELLLKHVRPSLAVPQSIVCQKDVVGDRVLPEQQVRSAFVALPVSLRQSQADETYFHHYESSADILRWVAGCSAEPANEGGA